MHVFDAAAAFAWIEEWLLLTPLATTYAAGVDVGRVWHGHDIVDLSHGDLYDDREASETSEVATWGGGEAFEINGRECGTHYYEKDDALSN